MPFKLTPGLIVVAAIIFFVFIGAIYAATSGGGNKPSSPAGMVVVTIRGDVGVDAVTILNMNTGNSIVKPSLTLPFSFNITKDSNIQLLVTAKAGFSFNAWTFATGTFDNHNPLIMKITGNTVASAETLLLPAKSSPGE